jgi:UDP-N-acetylmuramyl pentapeptide synthase
MLDLASAAQALGARRVGGNAEFMRVNTDSRDIRSGDLFVGIRGERSTARRSPRRHSAPARSRQW